MDVVRWPSSFVDGFAAASKAEGGCVVSRCKDIKWKPLIKGYFKINSDVSTDEVFQRTGIGIVIRDCFGRVLVSCAQGLDSLFSPPIAEAIAILCGLNLAI
ncbi:hypothetical protein ACOSQ2_005628 [Xanthoceras sorbifolium]